MTTQDQSPSMDAIKERMHKVWTSGEYARIGNPLVLIGELLCEAVNLHSSEKVLDVATGSGNTAISAAVSARCPGWTSPRNPSSTRAGGPRPRAWR